MEIKCKHDLFISYNIEKSLLSKIRFMLQSKYVYIIIANKEMM